MSQAPQFVGSFPRHRDIPCTDLPWIAFAGRSNAGKSSCINRVFRSSGLARVSKTPGRTQLLNVFQVRRDYAVVDLPGYGFARVPEKVRRGWDQMVGGLLAEAPQIALVIIIMDVRHPPTGLDIGMVEWCRQVERPCLVVFTKADKLSRNRGQRNRQAYARELGLDVEETVLFSAPAGTGAGEVRAALASAASSWSEELGHTDIEVEASELPTETPAPGADLSEQTASSRPRPARRPRARRVSLADLRGPGSGSSGSSRPSGSSRSRSSGSSGSDRSPSGSSRSSHSSRSSNRSSGSSRFATGSSRSAGGERGARRGGAPRGDSRSGHRRSGRSEDREERSSKRRGARAAGRSGGESRRSSRSDRSKETRSTGSRRSDRRSPEGSPGTRNAMGGRALSSVRADGEVAVKRRSRFKKPSASPGAALYKRNAPDQEEEPPRRRKRR